jgi:small redox-active disulfide protein 2
MQIRVLGSGCASCRTLTARATEAAAGAGLDVDVEEVHDVAEIAAWGVMRTPALVVDDNVVLAGRVPSVAELGELLSAAVQAGSSSSDRQS